MIFLFISSVQSLSRVRLFSTPWIAARQASLSITNSRSSLRLTSIVSVMPSSHLILCRPLLLSLPVSESFPVSQLFAWGGQSTGVSALASFLPKKSANIYFTSCFFFSSLKAPIIRICIIFPGDAVVQNPPANAGDTRVAGSIPGWGRSLGEGHGTHSSILAWRSPWTEEPGGLQFMESQSQTWLSMDAHTWRTQCKLF